MVLFGEGGTHNSGQGLFLALCLRLTLAMLGLEEGRGDGSWIASVLSRLSNLSKVLFLEQKLVGRDLQIKNKMI